MSVFFETFLYVFDTPIQIFRITEFLISVWVPFNDALLCTFGVTWFLFYGNVCIGFPVTDIEFNPFFFLLTFDSRSRAANLFSCSSPLVNVMRSGSMLFRWSNNSCALCRLHFSTLSSTYQDKLFNSGYPPLAVSIKCDNQPCMLRLSLLNTVKPV